jgi:3-methyladenine DNA glycosylase AlkD/predicted kinase
MNKTEIKNDIRKLIEIPAHRASNKALFLFSGLPGSGKSTLAEEIYQQNKEESIYLAADQIALEYKLDQTVNYHWTFEIFDELIAEYLEASYSVVADANLDKYEIRKEYYQLAENFEAEVRLFYLKTNLAEIKARQQQRNQLSDSELRSSALYSHDQEEIDNYLQEFETPRKSEKVYLIDGNFDFKEQLDSWQQVETNNLFAYIDAVRSSLAQNSDPKKAEGMEGYMRDQFPFYGLQAAERRKTLRKYMRQDERPKFRQLKTAVKKLWQLPEREFQYFAQELVLKYEQQYTEEIIDLFEYMLTNKSWWDTVDHIAKKLVGKYFQLFPEERDPKIREWLESGNIWLQRTALLFQLGYKEETDAQLLFDLIEKLRDIDEFFIQKAIGWALREYSKLEPLAVVKFANTHQLSSLAEREALKVVKRNK